MYRFEVVCRDAAGLHTRPAARLVLLARQYAASIRVRAGERSADARQLLALMRLGVGRGDTLHIDVDGPDETAAVSALRALFDELDALG
ncbi:HPr family phosphocarrier protein [Jeongeupia chitinilytica]|uniref:Phosphocarrier protein HPr n=1 Tax=Jeongeupia chitinilytica TaxID=1041641 RepID=A0ABQ3GZA5_9NEIS|nr:HPr family phosphocarrier protein [Jeongeupia chitinilytica]GHD62527.1 PTS sugar transporter [Jeongeupia chitinilytica]